MFKIAKSIFSERWANEDPTILQIHQKEMGIFPASFEASHENLSPHTTRSILLHLGNATKQ